MILTCELCQSQFLTESDPHVIIPGPETKVYCLCALNKKSKQLEAENVEWENAYVKEAQDHATTAINLQKLISELEAENTKLRECVEFYAETGNWMRSLLESSTLREIDDSDVSWTDTGGTYGEILSGGKRARQVLKELEK